jgi:hypothetical protein
MKTILFLLIILSLTGCKMFDLKSKTDSLSKKNLELDKDTGIYKLKPTQRTDRIEETPIFNQKDETAKKPVKKNPKKKKESSPTEETKPDDTNLTEIKTQSENATGAARTNIAQPNEPTKNEDLIQQATVETEAEETSRIKIENKKKGLFLDLAVYYFLIILMCAGYFLFKEYNFFVKTKNPFKNIAGKNSNRRKNPEPSHTPDRRR